MGHTDRRVVIVTGANRGIGNAIVRQLAAAGMIVVLTARDEKQAETAASQLSKLGEVLAKQLDITDSLSVGRLRDGLLQDLGRVDVLINNAGILMEDDDEATKVDLEVVRRTFETNVVGSWRMAQAFIPVMLEQNYGRIVNVSSGSGSISGGMDHDNAAYSLSKASLNALTVLLAAQTKPHNILVNALSPGWVKTDMGGTDATRSVEEAADTPVWLATLPDGGPTGGFFRDRQSIAW
jgi:NAD(P)-dependent dehydrogenase (short-subunit alcohol dehydrogenase family)